MVVSNMGNDMIRQQQQTQQMLQQYKKNHIQTRTAKTVTKRILLVSPEDDVNLALTLALEKELGDADKTPLNFESFNVPLLALKILKNGHYDLLIIDIVMPQMMALNYLKK
jgi:CheY-like chemotaxis protein